MVRFLIHRPIAVTMILIATLVLGIVAIAYIPVSLMPDINVPKITIQVTHKNASARELENTVVTPLRRELLQIAHLEDLKSETRDETGIIKLNFEHGTDIDFAFIEANEKIDRAMNLFPQGMARPKVIKASATDIPVFYLDITLKADEAPLPSSFSKSLTGKIKATDNHYPVSQKFVALSSFALQVIRKRLEQLPEVAMVDMSGMVYPELLIIPDMQKLESLQLLPEQLGDIIRRSNVALGNLLIHDGQYQYNVRFGSSLTNKRDIEDLHIRVKDRVLQLKNIAAVIEHPQQQKGLVLSDGKHALTLAIIKQSDARINELKEKLHNLVDNFRQDYPHLSFTVTRDQTQLLDYSISNLNQDLIWGAILALLTMSLFLKDVKSPLLIGLTMPASLIVSLILFYICGISINIISLSGLVLGIGMMIDNSIIVIDNITQYRARGDSLDDACAKGAGEVFIPMLSSVLTTCAVFIPLIFISGIAGALFYDEAMAVAIGAFVSLLISVTLIPVYFRLLYKKENNTAIQVWLQAVNTLNYEAAYEKSFKYIMRHQKTTWSVVLVILLAGILLYFDLPKSKLPPLTKDEVMVVIDWNERINVTENKKRVLELLGQFQAQLANHAALVGEQDFLLDTRQATAPEALLYCKVNDPGQLVFIQQKMTRLLQQHYPQAALAFKDSGNIFNLIFSDDEPPLIVRLRQVQNFGPRKNELLKDAVSEIRKAVPDVLIEDITWQEHIVLKADQVKLLTYDIAYDVFYTKLRNAFQEQQVFLLSNNQELLPVMVGGNSKSVDQILSETEVPGKDGNLYPVREFIMESGSVDLKTVIAGKEGEYYPLNMIVDEDQALTIMSKLKTLLREKNFFEADFTGSLFSNKKLISELTIVLLISLAMLYFILAAQFESLSLPVIILLEIPIDIAGAFIFLKIFGSGINLMSMIGLVVMGGIIINDSILKIDTINQLRKEGYPLLKAVMTGGQRRLKSILMTSLTTVLAMIPLLLTPGLGAELQKPLALALMGGMIIGTVVSLYFIPLCYYYLEKKPARIRPI